MKLLSNEKQSELLDFFEEVVAGQYLPVGLAGQAKYWSLELKQKRVRKIKTLPDSEIPTNNVVDN